MLFVLSVLVVEWSSVARIRLKTAFWNMIYFSLGLQFLNFSRRKSLTRSLGEMEGILKLTSCSSASSWSAWVVADLREAMISSAFWSNNVAKLVRSKKSHQYCLSLSLLLDVLFCLVFFCWYWIAFIQSSNVLGIDLRPLVPKYRRPNLLTNASPLFCSVIAWPSLAFGTHLFSNKTISLSVLSAQCSGNKSLFFDRMLRNPMNGRHFLQFSKNANSTKYWE